MTKLKKSKNDIIKIQEDFAHTEKILHHMGYKYFVTDSEPFPELLPEQEHLFQTACGESPLCDSKINQDFFLLNWLKKRVS